MPIRRDASHKSEQVSQLLFGETAEVLEDNNEWIRIKCRFDSYEGWIEKKVVTRTASISTDAGIAAGFARLVRINGESLWLSSGCELHPDLIDKQSATVVTINPDINISSIAELALQFMGTPYLWGGRTFMGIDCSGLVQVVFKSVGIQLPRDASQQINVGEVVQFPSDAKSGDLAFFDNEEGEITHVGIVLEPGKIIHASGVVRIDKLDHQGIYNEQLGKYSHKLRLIKRVS